MNRRNFIRAAALLIPGAFAGRIDAATAERAPDYFFYDERFQQARQLASDLSGSSAPTPVQSDVTNVWNAFLNRACRESPLTMRGVTTESFHFCLKIMAGERVRVDTQIVRLDRDLYLWTLRTLL